MAFFIFIFFFYPFFSAHFRIADSFSLLLPLLVYGDISHAVLVVFPRSGVLNLL